MVRKVKNALDRCLAFLTRNDLLLPDNLPKALNDPNLKKAINVLNVMNFTPEEREAYEGHLKWLRIEANTLKKAEQKGMEKGIEKGIEKGMEKEKINTAKNMLEKNLTLELISEVTGLPIE
jgi:predicted transposase/invertase (TIGR01784 family)